MKTPDIANADSPPNATDSAVLRLAELVYEESRSRFRDRPVWSDLLPESREYYAGLIKRGFFTCRDALPRGTNADDRNDIVIDALRSALEVADPSAAFYDCPDADTGSLMTTVDGRFDMSVVATRLMANLQAAGRL